MRLQQKLLVFFSGGVDSFSTLITKLDEKPDLITIWGADVDFENEDAWKTVKEFTENVAEKYQLKNVLIKTAIRRFIDNTELENSYHDILKDDWWHAVQHGMGLIGNIAPYAYKYKLKTVYMPSTYTQEDDVVCASNPNIDNCIKFGNTRIFHEGFQNNRQDKIKIICNYIKNTGNNLQLRVCFRSKKGDNCCRCEKCYRTIIAILSQSLEPKEFGFLYNMEDLQYMQNKLQNEKIEENKRMLWQQIQKECIQNKEKLKNNNKINWIFSVNFNK